MTTALLGQEGNYKPVRDSFRLVLAVGKDTTYESEIKSSPYLSGPNVLQLYPGEKVLIEVEQNNGVIGTMKAVKENRNPDKTLEISFSQNAENNTHIGMMLKVQNPFKMDLSYSAMILLMRSNKWVGTTIIPVKAGLASFEMWPDIIVSIGLGGWLFIKK